MAVIENIRPNGKVPKKICKVINGELVEVNKIYKVLNGLPVVVWEHKLDNQIILKVDLVGTKLALGTLFYKGGYTYDIDWGDGSVDTHILSSDKPYHVYKELGRYTVKISNYGNDTIQGTLITEDGYNNIAQKSLIEAYIPDSIVKIPNELFLRCPQLKTVRLSDNIEAINMYTFAYCSSLSNVNVPKSLKKMDVMAFGDCTSLKHFEIPSGIWVNGSFGGSGLVHVDVPDLEYLGDATFHDCKDLKTFTWNYKNEIPYRTFMNSGVSWYVPPTVEIIGGQAFRGCQNLGETIVIPSHITSIGSLAFEGTNVTEIYVMKNRKELSGQPWGATGAIVHFLDD